MSWGGDCSPASSGAISVAIVKSRTRWVLAGLTLGMVALLTARGLAGGRVGAPWTGSRAGASATLPITNSTAPSSPSRVAPTAVGLPTALTPQPPRGAASDPPPLDPGYPVDLDRIRAQIPGNLYWSTQAPTDDPETKSRRDQESSAWNVLYGKVLSGTASASQLRSYFDHRRQVSEDAIEFAELVLADYGSQLPDRDRGLLELAVQMHQTRLAELPRQEAEAKARKEEQDRRRAEWNGRPPP